MEIYKISTIEELLENNTYPGRGIIIGKTPAVIAGMIRGKCFVPKPELAVFREIDAEYPMSMAQKYQYEVCRSLGTTIDVIDMTYYFPLDGDVDSDRLKKAVEDVVNGNPIYRSHIDLERERLLVDRRAFSVREVHLNADAFGPYRAARYTRVRDLKTDPLFECELIRLDDGSAFPGCASGALFRPGCQLGLFIRSGCRKSAGPL